MGWHEICWQTFFIPTDFFRGMPTSKWDTSNTMTLCNFVTYSISWWILRRRSAIPFWWPRCENNATNAQKVPFMCAKNRDIKLLMPIPCRKLIIYCAASFIPVIGSYCTGRVAISHFIHRYHRLVALVAFQQSEICIFTLEYVFQPTMLSLIHTPLRDCRYFVYRAIRGWRMRTPMTLHRPLEWENLPLWNPQPA